MVTKEQAPMIIVENAFTYTVCDATTNRTYAIIYKDSPHAKGMLRAIRKVLEHHLEWESRIVAGRE